MLRESYRLLVYFYLFSHRCFSFFDSDSAEFSPSTIFMFLALCIIIKKFSLILLFSNKAQDNLQDGLETLVSLPDGLVLYVCAWVSLLLPTSFPRSTTVSEVAAVAAFSRYRRAAGSFCSNSRIASLTLSSARSGL
jgi:hypothetical protein